MALTAQRHPDLVGTMAFIMACNCSPETFDAATGFHTVTVHGVKLRITADLEYVVEQDLFVAKKKTSMKDRKLMTAAAYRVRAAYSTTRVESQVGHRRLTVYRELRGDDKAPIFFAKSRAQGGKTPPPVMAVSIMRYYVDVMGVTGLGLDKYPEFMQLLNGIELLPNCALDEALRGKHMRNLISQNAEDADSNSDKEEVAPEQVEGIALEDVMRDLQATKAELAIYKKGKKDPLKALRKEQKALRKELNALRLLIAPEPVAVATIDTA